MNLYELLAYWQVENQPIHKHLLYKCYVATPAYPFLGGGGFIHTNNNCLSLSYYYEKTKAL